MRKDISIERSFASRWPYGGFTDRHFNDDTMTDEAMTCYHLSHGIRSKGRRRLNLQFDRHSAFDDIAEC